MSGGSHIEVIGHRGYSARAPENTLAALRWALEAGADAVEWDVHVTACGTPVLFHDETLERTTDGRGRVEDHTLAQLRTLDAGSWFGELFAGEPVPTLAEALEEIRPFGTSAYVEVKGVRDAGDLDRIAGLVRELGMSTRTAYISLDFDLVDRLAALDPEGRGGYVLDRHAQFRDALGRARALGDRGLLDFSHRMLLEDPHLVPRTRAQGVDVATWTVNTVEEAEALARAGVRRFTTNEVEQLVRWRAARSRGG